MNDVAVILPAAGKSLRFGGQRGKLLEALAGIPVIQRTIKAFVERADVAQVVIATGPGQSPQEALDLPPGQLPHPKIRCTPGGENRAQSVLLALKQVPAAIEWVAVHDAARPLISRDLIDRTFAAAKQYGAAVPALAVSLTVKQAKGPLPAPVERTLPRHTLWAMQTPQVMRRADLLDAFDRCPLPLDQVTDDVQLLELCGHPVWLITGEERNLKITTPSDMHLAEVLVAKM